MKQLKLIILDTFSNLKSHLDNSKLKKSRIIHYSKIYISDSKFKELGLDSFHVHQTIINNNFTNTDYDDIAKICGDLNTFVKYISDLSIENYEIIYFVTYRKIFQPHRFKLFKIMFNHLKTFHYEIDKISRQYKYDMCNLETIKFDPTILDMLSPLSLVMLSNYYSFYDITENADDTILCNFLHILNALKQRNIKPSGKFINDIFFDYDNILITIIHLHLYEENHNKYLELYDYFMKYNSIANKTIIVLFDRCSLNMAAVEIIDTRISYDKVLKLMENNSYLNVPFVIHIYHELFDKNNLMFIRDIDFDPNLVDTDKTIILKIKELTEKFLINHVNDIPKHLLIEWCVNCGLTKVLDEIIYNREPLNFKEAGLIASTLNSKYINELILSDVKINAEFWGVFHGNWGKSIIKIFDFNKNDFIDNYLKTYENLFFNVYSYLPEANDKNELEYMLTRFIDGPYATYSIDWNESFRNKKILQKILNYYIDRLVPLSVENCIKLHKLNINIPKEYITKTFNKSQLDKIMKKCKNLL